METGQVGSKGGEMGGGMTKGGEEEAGIKRVIFN